VISGPGGVGKGTVAKTVASRVPRLMLSRSWTTRAPRPGETEEDYHFVSREEFERARSEGKFLEWAEYMGNLYGTPIPSPPLGYDVLLEIELQGARQVKESAPGRTRVILLTPPTMEELAARMRKRGDSEDRIKARLQRAAAEIELGRELADYEVVNDDLNGCVERIVGIIEEVRRTASNQ
jgi:guanylate kinase